MARDVGVLSLGEEEQRFGPGEDRPGGRSSHHSLKAFLRTEGCFASLLIKEALPYRY